MSELHERYGNIREHVEGRELTSKSGEMAAEFLLRGIGFTNDYLLTDGDWALVTPEYSSTTGRMMIVGLDLSREVDLSELRRENSELELRPEGFITGAANWFVGDSNRVLGPDAPRAILLAGFARDQAYRITGERVLQTNVRNVFDATLEAVRAGMVREDHLEALRAG